MNIPRTLGRKHHARRSSSRRLLTVALAAAGCLLAASPAADARRLPTFAESIQIADATGLATGCQIARVSTVDPRYAFARSTNQVGCKNGDGYFLLRRTSATARLALVRSAPLDSYPCPLAGLPFRAGLDLGVCRRPLTFLGCAESNDEGFYLTRRERPRSCGLLALRGTGLFLRSMRWSGWGRAVAHGRGLTGSRRIWVKVYRRVKVDGDYCYSRIRYRGKFGVGTLRFARCDADL